MALCFFVADLHGKTSRYDSLWQKILNEKPDAVFLGGDLLPHVMDSSWQEDPDQADFILDYLVPRFSALKQSLGHEYPKVFLILGNDDPRIFETELIEGQESGLWEYIHGRVVSWQGYSILGYSCIPPSPFQLKDWERYDVSQFVDPGCISPEEGRRTAGPSNREIRYSTIAGELEGIASLVEDFSRLILLSHCPPYDCHLDRAALDGKMFEHVPLDVHIGSIAIRRFIDDMKPLLTLHGHVHESRSITGNWLDTFGPTTAFSAANHTPDLALVRFDPADLDGATLELID